ncbi:histone deacetylase complex subunit SAP18 [Nephila pilipes]|uniref:18 kDa Sin3-associated polypeptide n=1 Tax=Nephila pilipes TaxID=299642 RepID=A0A8X6QCP0_NEPPI|nr:histone deacetylase complex subunit SAP18 [Nephila pilipes]
MSRPSGGIESVIEEKFRTTRRLDRDNTCPFLLRVFLNDGRHNLLNEYHRGNTPKNEQQFHAWMDTSLVEISKSIQIALPEYRQKGTYFDFAIVFPNDRHPGYRMKDVGSTCVGQRGPDDEKTLSQCRFQIGDFFDIAITPPSIRDEPSTSYTER